MDYNGHTIPIMSLTYQGTYFGVKLVMIFIITSWKPAPTALQVLNVDLTTPSRSIFYKLQVKREQVH